MVDNPYAISTLDSGINYSIKGRERMHTLALSSAWQDAAREWLRAMCADYSESGTTRAQKEWATRTTILEKHEAMLQKLVVDNPWLHGQREDGIIIRPEQHPRFTQGYAENMPVTAQLHSVLRQWLDAEAGKMGFKLTGTILSPQTMNQMRPLAAMSEHQANNPVRPGKTIIGPGADNQTTTADAPSSLVLSDSWREKAKSWLASMDRSSLQPTVRGSARMQAQTECYEQMMQQLIVDNPALRDMRGVIVGANGIPSFTNRAPQVLRLKQILRESINEIAAEMSIAYDGNVFSSSPDSNRVRPSIER